ncbi:unnamed protein product, partial [Tetraodon nigroviridis]
PSAMPGPMMPTDVLMEFYLSSSPPALRGFLGPYEELQKAQKRVGTCRYRQQQLYKPLRPCLSSQPRLAVADGGGGQPCAGWTANSKAAKKKVVFADSKGMSLTAIHIFSSFDDEVFRNRPGGGDELQFAMNDLQAAVVDLKISSERSLLLDFQQPSADYLGFRNRLIQNLVCLENCSLQERSLTGTIKVRNVGFQKLVRLRATFDSWASFTDVDCTFLNNVYSCQDTDTFAFVLELPNFILPQHRVEFCICYQVQDQTFWDNNDGKNYTLKHRGWMGEELSVLREDRNLENAGVKLLEMEFDQFGSPRTSSGQFPGWQSWAGIDNTVPY